MDVNDLTTGFGFEIFDSIYNGVVAIDQQGIIKLFNEAAAKIMGVAKEETIGRRVEEVIPNTSLLEILKTGKAENNQKMHLGNCEIISNRGPICKDGKIVGAIGVFQDISDFEALSLELDNVKEINNDLDAIIESVADGIVVGSADGMILRANSAYLQITGIQEKEFVGKNVRELINQGYMNKSVTEMVFRTKSRVNVVDIRSGKELLMTGAPVFNEEKEVTRVVTIVRDISELTELKGKLEQAEDAKNRYLKELEHFRSQNAFKKIITKNNDMQKKLDTAYHVARVDSTVLILGESGVGKELIAQLIHRASHRSEKPFIKINCGAIPANLLESEFFGYEAGSFTGALKEGKKGLFELADGGTLFLDEVGELPLEHQVKVLRAIQEKEILRVGGKKTIKLDIRIIAATNRDLEAMIREKAFREDLYYRLNVVPMTIPPLRQRKEDVIPIALELLARYNTAYGYQKWIHPEVMDCLLNYDWPGNIRELENTIERLVVTSMDDCITKDAMAEIKSIDVHPAPNGLTSLKAFLEKEENRLLEEAYRLMGSTRKAAAVLGISQSSMVKKMKKYGIEIQN
ncbi:LOW QUALITY PROTEIN: PAS modulated Fis family sigma54 specific transcriptional regulator [Desulfitobacterium sp. LBE]|uniref:HTH-type transcriptional regulatory protein TyrR n=1 Tax=Desulfitobacterium hafniense TaxID=49338 RepID=A0A0W1JPV4_DESHA|nr:sigma 54-interacting transcriptional regulator [Desulfitobacterium hafniense]KTE93683.1 Fis family transcriptional regulator [Desulfitobacterium hafniense]TWH59456.1 LOW QUALITY PROTEIN: PAS modulated Fis family sigma54 specific transcriptional regulator [Desulfitobacterium sp. LBE]